MPNYVQPNTQSPAPGVATVQLENVGNPLRVTGPQSTYNQSDTGARALLTTQLKGTYLGNSKHTYPNGTSVQL